MADQPPSPRFLPAKAANILALSDTRKTMIFAFCFMLTFIVGTVFVIFNPSAYPSSPWLLRKFVNFNNPSFFSSNGPHISSFFAHLFSNISSLSNAVAPSPSQLCQCDVNDVPTLLDNITKSSNDSFSGTNDDDINISPSESQTFDVPTFLANDTKSSNTSVSSAEEDVFNISPSESQTSDVSTFLANDTKSSNDSISSSNDDEFHISPSESQTFEGDNLPPKLGSPGILENDHSDSDDATRRRRRREKGGNEFYESMVHCEFFDGEWVNDDSYPLYAPGSCPHIDEPFNCFVNGRPENAYEKYRWQPHGCDIPRLNSTHMLELLRGKRLVFVGDSLNRNMWESLVCVLRDSVEDKNSVFEVSGREDFRSEGSYSFIFRDHNFSVEFFRSPFLVKEWEEHKNGEKQETLRLDLVESSCDRYKDADILIFNTAHWWTHDKTLKGQGYYQEGSHVYDELEVNEAFRRAMTTWARWVDTNVDPKKTQVFFRGYSASHFGGGKWNSGGKCDMETKPFKDDKYLEGAPPIMEVLENVMKWMKVPVVYLNITKLSDYRKDAHPSIYRAEHLTDEERHSPLRYQDCAHWCLPGVPETWNELVYAKILIRHYLRQKDEHLHE